MESFPRSLVPNRRPEVVSQRHQDAPLADPTIPGSGPASLCRSGAGRRSGPGDLGSALKPRVLWPLLRDRPIMEVVLNRFSLGNFGDASRFGLET